MKKIQNVKGTRDLYPEDYAPIRRIFDVWREASIYHGFEEFEGPTLELLELYREKSGEELVGQLYRLTDSGGRELALRPEMTPTLARMVAARINALPRPIKWFCIPKLFRGENVQRGRLREFFQWNVDIIGTPDMIADAECISVGVEALRRLGLTHEDFTVRISSRRLIAAMFECLGIPADMHAGAYAILDKAGKLPGEELNRRWAEGFARFVAFDALMDILRCSDLAQLPAAVGRLGQASPVLSDATRELTDLMEHLQGFGAGDYCQIDLMIVRGLAYYTGPVFEFYDCSQSERAICGGGRYDDLLGKLGKSREPAVGFGMGDVVLSLILEEKGLLKPGRTTEGIVFVADAAEGLRPQVLRLTAAIRRAGLAAEFSYQRQALGKQFKMAEKRQCAQVVILGDETVDRGGATIKDLSTGTSREVSLEALCQDPHVVLRARPKA